MTETLRSAQGDGGFASLWLSRHSEPKAKNLSPHSQSLSHRERGISSLSLLVGKGLSRLKDKGFRSEICTRAFEVELRLCTFSAPQGEEPKKVNSSPRKQGEPVRGGQTHISLTYPSLSNRFRS